jgi:hypothetical protein
LAAPIHHVVNTNESYELRKDRIRDDFEEASLRQLDNPQRNGIVVQQYLARRADYGKTLVFAINVAHAENLVAEFRKTAPDVRVANILGTTDATARRRLVDDFEKGRLDVLVNCKVFVEGFNCKDIETVFLTRPTMSAVLYCQMVGRGTRVVGGKKTFHLVEFEDQLSKYADKLAGFWSLGESDREVIRAATERAKARPGDAPLLLPPGQAAQWSADLHVLGGVLAYWDARAFVQGATLVYRQELDNVARAVPAGGAIDRPGLVAAFMAGHWTSEEREFLARSVRDDFVFHFYDFSRTDVAPPPTAPPAVAAIHSTARAVAPLSKIESFLGPPERVDWGGDATEWRREFLTQQHRVAGVLRIVDDLTGKVIPQKVFSIEEPKIRAALSEVEKARGCNSDRFFSLQTEVYAKHLKGTSITEYKWYCAAKSSYKGIPLYLDLRNGTVGSCV